MKGREYAALAAVALVFAAVVAALAFSVSRTAQPTTPATTTAVVTDGTVQDSESSVPETTAPPESSPPETTDVTYTTDAPETTDTDNVTLPAETTDAVTSNIPETTTPTETKPQESVKSPKIMISGNYTPSAEAFAALSGAIKSFGRPTGLIAVDIETGMTVAYNADKSFAPASIVKVVYALYCFRLIDAGEASLDELLTYTANDTVHGNGVIGKMGVGAVLTLNDVLYHTINTSDNEGYYMLLRRFGSAGCDEMTSALGCKTCKLKTSKWPKVSARDMALIWEEIYRYSTETECGRMFYDMLQNVQRMHFFRDALGDGYEVANKSGWNSTACCEGGVIFGGGRTYILVILTEGSYYTADMNAFGDMVRAVDTMMSEYGVTLTE